MNTQLDIFSQPPITGEMKRDIGMQQSIDHANEVCENWSTIAYNFFINYAKNIGKPFMTADVVEAAKGIVPAAPDGRAWGQIPVKAKRAGLIIWIDYARGNNPKHHKNPRSLWEWNKI